MTSQPSLRWAPTPGGFAEVSSDLARIEEILLAAGGASANPLVRDAATHLIRAGGKRLRPALVLLGSRAGVPGRHSTDLAAAALELIHLASLYHDDVMDQTEVRRGVQTANHKWGAGIAVLAGDYLFASGCALGARAGGEVPAILAQALMEICDGQIAETASIGDPARTTRDYLDTIRLKTATLFRAAGELAASTADVPPQLREALTRYGENLGMAFQIVDDLLDFVGDPRVTGKTPGTDLRAGVYTLPLLIAAERDPRVSGHLNGGGRNLDAVLPLLDASGALDTALRHARRHAHDALLALDALPDTSWRNVLVEVVEGVLAQVR